MDNSLASFVRLCRRLGSDTLLAQGGGGNVSLKTGSDEMLITASGGRLAQVGPRRGWARADTQKLRQGMASIGGDRAYAKLLARAGLTRGRRISMEAGFHALLPDTCVAHVHSLAGILLGALPEQTARKKIRRVLGNKIRIYFIPACVPGVDLSLRIGARRPRGPSLGVLKNHGLVWAAESAAATARLSDKFERALRKVYRLSRFPPPHTHGPASAGWRTLCFCHWPDCRLDLRPLFPDFVAYFSLWGRGKPDLVPASPRAVRVFAKDARALRTKRESLYAQALVSTVARGKIHRLPPRLVRAVDRLETERLRALQAARL